MKKTPKVNRKMREPLERIPTQNEESPTKRKEASAVGVFFVHGDNLWIDATPVDEAILYGDGRTHDRGHEAVWEQLQASGAAPRDEEYDECPRGRVCYDTRQRIFHLYLDQCIRKNKEMVARIIRAMNLTSATRAELDSHYKCPRCTNELAGFVK
jgi:hypothetical protein